MALGFAYFAGAIATFEDKQATEFVNLGFAVQVDKETINLPEGFPYRERFAVLEIDTVSEVVESLTDLEGFEGFTPEMATKVKAHLIENKIISESIPSECELPEDFPFRDVFEGLGYNTLEEIKGVEDLLTLKGVGEATANAVTEYLNK